MNSRRKFLKNSAFAGIVVISSPNLAFTNTKTSIFSESDLIGKGNPKLYGTGYKLQKKAHQAFLEMNYAAKRNKMNIRVVSSYRSFNHQNLIWTRKYKRYRSRNLTSQQAVLYNIRYTAIPGSSRHHWGTEIDVVNGSIKTSRYPLNTKNFHGYGIYKSFREWMDSNAHKYGFYLVYTDQPDRKGFKYEPWHYSYKPLSSKYLREYRKLNHQTLLKNENILGCEYFTNVFIDKYLNENILDINPRLL